MYDVDGLLRTDGFADRLRDSLTTGSAPPLLRDAKIKLTSRCNLRCQMCRYWQTRTEDALPTETWRRVLTDLVALGGRKIHFSGGEVFLRRDFLDLVEHATGLGLKTNLTTNGTLVTRDKARRLVDAGVNSVSISLDGAGARVHDAVRGREGAFRTSLRTIRWLRRDAEARRAKLKVRINFVVMSENFRDLPDMVDLAAELGAVDLNPMPVDEKGPRKHRLSRGQIEDYNRDIAPLVAERRAAAGFSLDPAKIHPFGTTSSDLRYAKQGLYARGYYERRPCLVPWLHTFIAWNGETYLCCMTNGRMESLGNVAQTSVSAVFHGEGYRRVRAAFMALDHLPECHRCDQFLDENRRLHDGVTPSP